MAKKVVFITGAAKRIGASIAINMAKYGFNVVIHYNNSKYEAENLSQEIQNNFDCDAIIVQADLSKENQIKDAYDKAISYFGKIDCLINNASMFKNDYLKTLDLKNWDNHLNVNLKAPVILSKLFVDNFTLNNNEKGNIINLLDYCVLNLPDKFFSYSISKFALWGATQSLAKQIAPDIKVNAIGLGHSMPNYKETEDSFKAAQEKTPLKNGADKDEIFGAIKFIINSASLTGHMIPLDGGKHLIGAEYY